jgi:hypothetical protein
VNPGLNPGCGVLRFGLCWRITMSGYSIDTFEYVLYKK